ncbi:MAG: hypothetical protein WCK55_11235 [Verrucomicrobiota bacterium]
MNMSILDTHRNVAAGKLKGAVTGGAVAFALAEMSRELRHALPDQTKKALDIEFRVNGDGLADLVWALRSKHLLAFREMRGVSPKNSSAETLFEKRLINEQDDNKAWGNQTPIWSGVNGHAAIGKKANIDLSHRVAENAFECFELKISGTNEAYAIAELASYVVGYLIVRKLAANYRDVCGVAQRPEISGKTVRQWKDSAIIGAIMDRPSSRSAKLLSARSIMWTVVAPKAFFASSPETRRAWQGGFKQFVLQTASELRVAPPETHFSMRMMRIAAPGQGADHSHWVEQLGRLDDVVLKADVPAELQR